MCATRAMLFAMTRAKASTYVALAGACLIAVIIGVAAGFQQAEMIAVALALLVVLVGFFLEAPEVSLLAFVVVRPAVDAFVFTSIAGFTLGQVWGIGLLAATIVYLATHRDVRFPAPLVAFLLAYVALTLVRPQLSVALDSALKLASWLLLAVALERIARSRRGQDAILTALWASALCLLGVIAFVIAEGRYGAAYYAYTDTTGNTASRPHALASLAVLIMPFVLAQIIAGRRTRLSLVVAGLLGLGIVLSFVRSAYLALAMVLAAFVYAGLHSKALRVRLSLVGMAAAMGFAVYFLWGAIVGRLADLPVIGSLLGAPPSASTGSGRAAFWMGLLRTGADSAKHILIGRGAGASAVINDAQFGIPIGSHNDFLEFFVTGGVILLGMYLAFLIWILAKMIRLYMDSRQSPTVHLCSVLLIGSFCGYVILAITNGITLAAGSVVMATIVGMTQGMLQTPGDTAFDLLEDPAGADLDAAAR
jgi:hypothetical protein